MPAMVNEWALVLARPDKRYFYLPGGRMSSKTTEAVHDLLKRACQPRPFQGKANVPATFLFTRWIAANLEKSLIPALKKAMETIEVADQFSYNKSTKEFAHKIWGHKVIGLGLWNSFDHLVGIEDLFHWFGDESQFYPDEIIEKLKDTMGRVPGHRIVLTGNVPSYDVAFYKRGKAEAKINPEAHFEVINYDKNGMLDDDAYKRIATVKATDPERYEHEFLAKPPTRREGQVYQQGIHWKTGNMDVEVARLGIQPLYGADWGGNQAGGGASPTVMLKCYAYDSPSMQRKIVYVQKTRHAYGIEDRFNPALLFGRDIHGAENDDLTERWDVPHENQYGDALFDGICDSALAKNIRIWTDHREASEKSLRDAGVANQRKAPKPKDCEMHRTNKIRSDFLIVVNDWLVPDTDIRECEQMLVDLPGYEYKESKTEPGLFDYHKFKDGSDHAPDALAYALSAVIFPITEPEPSGLVFSI